MFGAAGLCVIGLLLTLGFAPVGAAPTAPRVTSGSLDLSAWDFDTNGSVSLAGGWRFFPHRWANNLEGAPGTIGQIPGTWDAIDTKGERLGHGFATYAVRLQLPPTGEQFAIDTGYQYCAYRLYANGELVAASGVPAASAEKEIARVYSELALLPPGVRTVDLRLEVSNHLRNFGGSFVAPKIGLRGAIAGHRDLILAASILLVGAMLFGAAYHVVVFALSRETEGLWFGVFAVLLGVRTLLIEPLAGYAVPVIGQDWVWRVDFAATILIVPTAYWFFALNFPRQVAQRYAPALASLGVAGAVSSLALGPDVGALAIKLCQFSTPVLMIYLTQAIARAVWQREPGASLALAGWLLSAGATVHDILLDHGVITGINLIPFGFLTFFLCLSGTLVARYSDAFRRSEQLTRHVQTRNIDLEAAVAGRTRELSDKLDELRRSQVELERARSEAVSANVAKSRFLAMMSHELRTPLNSILGFSDIIRTETLGPLGDQRYGEYATHIHDSGAHLLNLIGDLLDISRIEAGKVDLRLEPLDLAEICENAARHAATRERRASDAVTMTFEPKLPLLKADQRAVTQMVINLLSNALKFTPEGGRIALYAARRQDGGISIEVTDNGVGMEADEIPKALALFTQVDDGHSRQHEGTGLGLPIVKSLVELHGGGLSLESEKGRGTVVRLDFPPHATVQRETAAA
jgi:two-component system, sensor histidine kinase ChiS